MLSLVISSIHQLTPRIRSYELRDANGQELPLVTAGAHIKIPVTQKGDATEFRYYSLCSNPAQRELYEIAIQIEEDESIMIHDFFKLGATFTCEIPSNSFPLHADTSPTVFIAGGIGITPIKPMVQTLARRGRRFQLHYAGRSLKDMAFNDFLASEFQQYYFTYPADEGKRLNIINVLTDAPHNAIFYVCGPTSLIEDTYNAANSLGIPKDRIHSEAFSITKNEKDKPVIVELARSNKLIHVDANQPLLAAIRDAGVTVDFDCCVGECGTCAVKIIEGEADHRDTALNDKQRADGMICICVSRARSEKLILDL